MRDDLTVTLTVQAEAGQYEWISRLLLLLIEPLKEFPPEESDFIVIFNGISTPERENYMHLISMGVQLVTGCDGDEGF